MADEFVGPYLPGQEPVTEKKPGFWETFGAALSGKVENLSLTPAAPATTAIVPTNPATRDQVIASQQAAAAGGIDPTMKTLIIVAGVAVAGLIAYNVMSRS